MVSKSLQRRTVKIFVWGTRLSLSSYHHTTQNGARNYCRLGAGFEPAITVFQSFQAVDVLNHVGTVSKAIDILNYVSTVSKGCERHLLLVIVRLKCILSLSIQVSPRAS